MFQKKCITRNTKNEFAQLPIVISISVCTKMDFKNVIWPKSGEVGEEFHLLCQIPNVDLGILGHLVCKSFE